MLNATDEIRYSPFVNPVTVNTSHHPQPHHHPHPPPHPRATIPTTITPPPPPSPPPANPAQTPATPSGRQPPAAVTTTPARSRAPSGPGTATDGDVGQERARRSHDRHGQPCPTGRRLSVPQQTVSDPLHVRSLHVRRIHARPIGVGHRRRRRIPTWLTRRRRSPSLVLPRPAEPSVARPRMDRADLVTPKSGRVLDRACRPTDRTGPPGPSPAPASRGPAYAASAVLWPRWSGLPRDGRRSGGPRCGPPGGRLRIRRRGRPPPGSPTPAAAAPAAAGGTRPTARPHGSPMPSSPSPRGAHSPIRRPLPGDASEVEVQPVGPSLEPIRREIS